MITPDAVSIQGRNYEATFDIDFEGDLTVEIRCRDTHMIPHGHCCPVSIMLGTADRDALTALLLVKGEKEI